LGLQTDYDIEEEKAANNEAFSKIKKIDKPMPKIEM
jgi:hypothetical protein